MSIINLKDFYPWYTQDEFVEVSEEVEAELLADKRYHKSHKLRMWRNKSYYSLDRGDGIEHAAKYVEPSPEELYMRKVEMEQLCDALNSLSEKQGRRVDAYYILGMKQYEIAKAEGVTDSCVSESISAGIRNMKNICKIFDPTSGFLPKVKQVNERGFSLSLTDGPDKLRPSFP